MSNRMRKIARIVGVFSLLAGALGANPAGAVTPQVSSVDTDLRAERDTLIDKIIRGEELEKSIERFTALSKTVQQRLDEVQGNADREKALKLEAEAGRKDLDYIVGHNCQLSADPKNPPLGRRDFMHADWGKVVDKQPAVLKARKPFDDDEKITLYKVQGQQRTYTISSKGPSLWFDKPLSANLGDLVLVCIVSVSSEGSGSQFPPGFRDDILSQGFAVPITEPPLIAKKRDRNPVHFPGRENEFVVALHRGEWPLREEHPVLARVLVKKSLGRFGDVFRYALAASDREEFVLEVPPDLRNRALLEPYHYAWVIMGKHRFDRTLKQLVLVAEEIEPRYVTQKN